MSVDTVFVSHAPIEEVVGNFLMDYCVGEDVLVYIDSPVLYTARVIVANWNLCLFEHRWHLITPRSREMQNITRDSCEPPYITRPIRLLKSLNSYTWLYSCDPELIIKWEKDHGGIYSQLAKFLEPLKDST